jgi:transcriptional regulator with XRE-family HTH domain
LSAARRARRWRLSDLAQRTGRNPGRLSEMETGKANRTVDSLSESGDVLGLALVLVPKTKLDAVLALIGATPSTAVAARQVPSAFEELFVRPPEDDAEEGDYARP